MSTVKWSPITAIDCHSAPGTLIIGSPGGGKAVWDEEKIYTPSGVRTIKDIKVGDYLFGQNGKPTKVLEVYPQGKKLQLYKVVLIDGRTLICSEDHRFTVGKRSHGVDKFEVMTVGDLLNAGLLNSQNRHRYFLQNNKCIQYKERTFKVDPYVLGAFLGNGCKTNGRHLEFSSPTYEVPNKIAKLLSKSLNTTVKAFKTNADNYTWQFYYADKGEVPTKKLVWAKDIDKSLVSLLTDTYSGDRYIPDEYKYCSEAQRWALVKGLMDTDGSIEGFPKYNMTYCSTSKTLIKDVVEVIRSLGMNYVSSTKEDVRKGKNTAYGIYIGCDNDRKVNFFSTGNKLRRAKEAQDFDKSRRYDILHIVDIIPFKKDYCTCFTVDADDHQFIAGECVVTHNTIAMLVFASNSTAMGLRCVMIDPKNDFNHLKNVYPDIHIVDINDIYPGALNPFEFLKKVNEDGTLEYIDTPILMTIIELLVGKEQMDPQTIVDVTPIITDFITRQRMATEHQYVDMQDVADYLYQNRSLCAQKVGSLLKVFENSKYGKLLFTRETDVKPLNVTATDSLIITLHGMALPGYGKDPKDYTTEERFTSTILYIITQKLNEILSAKKEIPVVLFCDEAHLLFGNPVMADIIDKFLRLGRSLKVATILASQGVESFPKDIAQYITTKFMFKSSPEEANMFLDKFYSGTGININRESVVSAVSNFKPGMAYMIDRLNRNGIIQIEPVYDIRLLNSDPPNVKDGEIVEDEEE